MPFTVPQRQDLHSFRLVFQAHGLVEPVSSETSATYFPDEAALVERLVTLLKAAKSLESWSYQESPVLAWQCFSAIIEASIHSAAFWNIFTWRPDIPGLIKEIVLDDPRLSLRKCVAERMSHVCKVLPKFVSGYSS
jgi:hypothetical protein